MADHTPRSRLSTRGDKYRDRGDHLPDVEDGARSRGASRQHSRAVSRGDVTSRSGRGDLTARSVSRPTTVGLGPSDEGDRRDRGYDAGSTAFEREVYGELDARYKRQKQIEAECRRLHNRQKKIESVVQDHVGDTMDALQRDAKEITDLRNLYSEMKDVVQSVGSKADKNEESGSALVAELQRRQEKEAKWRGAAEKWLKGSKEEIGTIKKRVEDTRHEVAKYLGKFNERIKGVEANVTEKDKALATLEDAMAAMDTKFAEGIKKRDEEAKETRRASIAEASAGTAALQAQMQEQLDKLMEKQEEAEKKLEEETKRMEKKVETEVQKRRAAQAEARTNAGKLKEMIKKTQAELKTQTVEAFRTASSRQVKLANAVKKAASMRLAGVGAVGDGGDADEAKRLQEINESAEMKELEASLFDVGIIEDDAGGDDGDGKDGGDSDGAGGATMSLVKRVIQLEVELGVMRDTVKQLSEARQAPVSRPASVASGAESDAEPDPLADNSAFGGLDSAPASRSSSVVGAGATVSGTGAAAGGLSAEEATTLRAEMAAMMARVRSLEANNAEQRVTLTRIEASQQVQHEQLASAQRQLAPSASVTALEEVGLSATGGPATTVTTTTFTSHSMAGASSVVPAPAAPAAVPAGMSSPPLPSSSAIVGMGAAAGGGADMMAHRALGKVERLEEVLRAEVAVRSRESKQMREAILKSTRAASVSVADAVQASQRASVELSEKLQQATARIQDELRSYSEAATASADGQEEAVLTLSVRLDGFRSRFDQRLTEIERVAERSREIMVTMPHFEELRAEVTAGAKVAAKDAAHKAMMEAYGQGTAAAATAAGDTTEGTVDAAGVGSTLGDPAQPVAADSAAAVDAGDGDGGDAEAGLRPLVPGAVRKDLDTVRSALLKLQSNFESHSAEASRQLRDLSEAAQRDRETLALAGQVSADTLKEMQEANLKATLDALRDELVTGFRQGLATEVEDRKSAIRAEATEREKSVLDATAKAQTSASNSVALLHKQVVDAERTQREAMADVQANVEKLSSGLASVVKQTGRAEEEASRANSRVEETRKELAARITEVTSSLRAAIEEEVKARSAADTADREAAAKAVAAVKRDAHDVVMNESASIAAMTKASLGAEAASRQADAAALKSSLATLVEDAKADIMASVKSSLTVESTDRVREGGEMKSSILAEATKQITSQVSASDHALRSLLTAEKAEREAQVSNLQKAMGVTAEASSKSAAEALDQKLADAVKAEAEAREQAVRKLESELRAAIDAEKEARVSGGDAASSTLRDTLKAEVASVREALEAETKAREVAIKGEAEERARRIDEAVQAEAEARQEALQAEGRGRSESVAKVEGEVNEAGKRAEAIAEETSERVDKLRKELVTQMKELELQVKASGNLGSGGGSAGAAASMPAASGDGDDNKAGAGALTESKDPEEAKDTAE